MIRLKKQYLTYITLPGLERKNVLTKFKAKQIQIIFWLHWYISYLVWLEYSFEFFGYKWIILIKQSDIF